MAEVIIETENLCKLFGQVWGLRHVNMTIHAGDIFGIIGLSGAGKSTLIRCLAGLETPSNGHVRFEGHDIGTLRGRRRRHFFHQIGMIFQHFNLLSSRTVYGNVAYALEVAGKKSEKRINELLALVGLEHKRDCYPTQLSGGEKQRVGIARALANHPKVLFCDEATSALDPKTTQEILQLLMQLNRKLGLTIVLITHEMEVIKQICHHVAVLENGEVVEKGPISRVFVDPQHPTTRYFLQTTIHEIPPHFLQEISPRRKLLRLGFKGTQADEPVISQMIKKYQVDANILQGWIDSLQTVTVGTLVIELLGEPENIEDALRYLQKHCAHCEEIYAPT